MKLIRWFFWVPVALVLISFAIAYRHTVQVSLDPLDAAEPLLALNLPLYLPVFGGILLGLLIGGAATWLKQGKYRVAARQSGRELDRLNKERPEPEVPVQAPAAGNEVPSIQPGRKLQSQSLAAPAEPEGKDDRAA